MTSNLKVVFGLGNNRTDDFKAIRHNVGADYVRCIASNYSIVSFGGDLVHRPVSSCPNGLLCAIVQKGQCLFGINNYHMNESGLVLQELLSLTSNREDIKTEQMLIIHDDIDLPLGRVKIKCGGSNAGHNGLKSITEAIGNNYMRLRIGIGGPPRGIKLLDHVLDEFDSDEVELLNTLLTIINGVIDDIATKPLDRVQNIYNNKSFCVTKEYVNLINTFKENE